MKKVILIVAVVCTCFANTSFGQDIPQSNVPSVIVNSFQKAYPNAADVEWEMKKDLYKVDFEIGAGIDHSLWYDNTGKLIKHKEAITKGSLPQAVLDKIKTDFPGHRIEDVSKITKGDKVTYKMELKSAKEEWKATFDATGTLIKKIAD